jgi:membrane-bound lytic murein transglycosylase F
MHNSAASYFLYRGAQMGFEYELAREFARELGVELEVLTPPPGRTLTAWLQEGKGDVIAGLVTAGEYALQPLQASIPYLDTPAEILTSSDKPSDLATLADQPIVLPPDSGDLTPLLAPLGAAPAAFVALDHGGEEIGEMVRAVTHGWATAALLPAPLARLAQTLYPDQLRTAGTLPGTVQRVWAVRPGQTELLQAINQYLARANRSGLRKILFEKYFVSTDHLRDVTRVAEFTLTSKRLSRYDPLIVRYAEEAGFDWRLVAALIFEESRFNHKQVSERGAYGLMQITPIAAQEIGVKKYTAPRDNIEAGVKYLQTLARQFPYGPRKDRLALVLASYLLGPGRVEDAQQLARMQGYDPHCWSESMEQVLPLLEDPVYYRDTRYGYAPGTYAVRYVNAVLRRYALYTRYVPRELTPLVEAQNTRTAYAASASG